jgi:hypothetical protein
MAKPRGTIKRFRDMGNAAAAKKIMVRGALSLRANFRCESASPRRDGPEFCKNCPPRNQRAQGMPGAAAPAASRANVS